MKVSHFAQIVTQREGGKKQISIAQVKEVLRILNGLTGGEFYKWVRKQPMQITLFTDRMEIKP